MIESVHDRNGSFATGMGRPSRVRFAPVSDRTADIAGGRFRADIVAKVPKVAAANFPPNNEKATIDDQ